MPSVGSNATIGIVDENVWGSGTPTVTVRIPFTSENIVKDKGIRASNAMTGKRQRSLWIEGKNTVGGDINSEIQPTNFGKLFKHALGLVDTYGPSGTSNYYVHNKYPSGTLPAGLRIEIDRVGGVFTYNGMKVNQMTLNCSVGDPLTGTFSLLGKDETVGAVGTGTVIAFPEVNPFTFDEGALYLDGSASAADVSSVSLTVNNNLLADKGRLGSKFRVAIPEGGFMDITGTINMEFDNVTTYNKFVNATETALQLKFVTDDVFGAGSTPYELWVTIPRIVFTGTTPTVGGPELIYHDLPFIGFKDPTGGFYEKDAIRMKYITSDATI